jgi:uncharacterized phage protein (TIGR01671 family)
MKQIKFRAWDKVNNKWVDHNQHLDDTQVSASVNPPSILEIKHQDWDFMQFTGLLDKNEKEIYEGDIVLNNDINWKTEFYDGSFVIREIGKETNKWLLLGEDKHCEIIGNIYENHELLN